MHRTAVVASVAVIAAAAAAAAAPSPPSEAARVRAAVEALPVIGEVEGGPTPVIVRGNLDPRRAKQMVALARQIHADVGKRFLTPPAAPGAPVTMCLFDSEDEYARVAAAFAGGAPSGWGFYRGDLRVALANLVAGVGNLRHELVHPLLGDDFPAIPAWLNEGMGSLYGTATATRAGFEPRVNYRLRDLHRAIDAGGLPTLDELVASTDGDVHGADAPTFYAMGRYLLLYLHRRGRLDATYAALRDAGRDTDAHRRIIGREVDDAAFVDWVRGLRYRSRRAAPGPRQ